MSSDSQPPLKRGRTSASKSREFESPSEELSHVANLVERRRVQNRISQRNYRNKIRNRLEKLEALVETNKAQKASEAQSPSASEAPGEYIDVEPAMILGQDHTLQGSPPSDVPHACMCAFRDANLLGLSEGGEFESRCSCGGVVEMNHSLSDPISPFSTFVDSNAADSVFNNLPSPESLHCNTPTNAFQEELMQFGSMSSTVGSLSDQTASSGSHSREPSLVSLDMPSTPPLHQPYDRISYPFPVPMGYQVVPMSYMTAAAHGEAANRDRAGGRPWTPTPINCPPGMRPVIPSSAMHHYILVPAPMMMVPMQHPHHAQYTNNCTPLSRPS